MHIVEDPMGLLAPNTLKLLQDKGFRPLYRGEGQFLAADPVDVAPFAVRAGVDVPSGAVGSDGPIEWQPFAVCGCAERLHADFEPLAQDIAEIAGAELFISEQRSCLRRSWNFNVLRRSLVHVLFLQSA